MGVQADDLEVLESALTWLQAGQPVALATVVRTWGSSPRPPGSLLAMSRAGRSAGSVSGGCVEDTLVTSYCDGEIAGPAPTWIDFGVDREDAARMGLPCGGRLELLVEHLLDSESIAVLLEQLHRGDVVTRRVVLPGGEVSLVRGAASPDFVATEHEVVKTFGPAWQLVVVGDGLLARHLASMARQLDYRVTICDPRETYADSQPIAGVHYSREMPDDAVRALGEASRTAIVAVAHDPRQDDLALSAALESEAFYIGALGSRRSAEARRERLAALGYDARQLARIHGPAGLHIGSKRPAEIALSILAELTALRNGVARQVESDAG
jgi:xanthine dehydrogenase accessory factor